MISKSAVFLIIFTGSLIFNFVMVIYIPIGVIISEAAILTPLQYKVFRTMFKITKILRSTRSRILENRLKYKAKI